MTFPKEYRTKLHSTNPIERLNGEIKRRTEVVGVRRANDPLDHLLFRLSPQPGGLRPPGRRTSARTER